MITLKDAIEAAQTDLRVLQREGINLIRPLGMLSGVLASLPEGGDAPILLAKDACEALIDCAHTAEDDEKADVAEQLRCVNRALSSVVAAQYSKLRDAITGQLYYEP